ncbi:toxin 50 [Anaerosporobacter mobilis DSM 15930]|uniref:Toxin 50 n=1 Tax=Anaerosporobacter mobilis DSM 15930 TaxID=1120996 RepID=A0A1M7MYD0_9FIRM|nr:phage minor capsid protein [Anaerosporobacter mobilis]SHM95658.1 toxin 50 [Anaerosporobacter mobilis DSM 15930]
MNEYDIEEAFQEIEEELINSMIRNMKRHRVEEVKEGIEWEQWQVKQLQALERYKRENRKRFESKFSDINSKMEDMIRKSREMGNMDQEIELLEMMKKGLFGNFVPKISETVAEFFRLNDRKLEALVKATKENMVKAETAMLRMANDQYRKIIFNAQVYANTSAGTYEKAVDMATKDFLSRGINCIEYANGARVSIDAYAKMAIQTANKRAYLAGEGEKRKEWGISTVIMNKRGAACPKCVKFAGKVLIDDVWSGGSAKDGKYPLMSAAIQKGLYHPHCKDKHTTYFEGISEEPKPLSKSEIELNSKQYTIQQKQRYYERQVRKYKRLEECSLDEENRIKYREKRIEWQNKNKILVNEHKDILRENYEAYRTRGVKQKPKDNVVNHNKDDIINNKIVEFKKKLENGEVNTKIKWNKQKEHVLGSKEWKKRVQDDIRLGKTPASSFLKEIDYNELITTNLGKGKIVFTNDKNLYPKEYIQNDEVIGRVFNVGTGRYEVTRRFAIHYSNKGIHAHPVKEKE